MLKWLYFWVYKVVTTETQQSKTLSLSKGKLAGDYIMIAEDIPKAKFTKYGTFGFSLCLRPNSLKWELQLWTNFKNTASVILCIFVSMCQPMFDQELFENMNFFKHKSAFNYFRNVLLMSLNLPKKKRNVFKEEFLP